MKLKFYPEKKLKREILQIISQYLDVKKYQVFVFGSRVSGQGNERSDIDIGIEGPRAIPIEIVGQIRESLKNLPTLYTIDVIDFKTASDDFQKVAKQHLELLIND